MDSADPQNATRYVLCIDARNGDLLWQREYPSTSHVLHARNTYASGTPVVDQHRVYVAWSTPEQLTLMALDHQGQEVWVRDLGTWVSQHGFGSSPILYQDLLILVNSQQAEQLDPGQLPGKSQVMAFESRTGQLRWSAPRTATRVCYSTPCIYRPADGEPELICCNTGDGIYSLDPKTGKANWSNQVFTLRTVASPIMVRDLVFGSNGSGGGGNFLVGVQAGTARKVVGPVKLAAYVATPVTYGDLVFTYYDRGMVQCFEADSGKRIWLERVSSGFSGSPVRVRDKLYCIDDEGVVIVLAADRRYKELARNPLGEHSRSTPAVSGERMFLRTLTQLICIGGEKTQ